MFRIIGFESTSDGKSRFIIETDDLSTGIFLRFFSQADKFAQLLHYRLTTESRLESSQKSKPENLARMRLHRARLLKRFREIPGTQPQKMKILQEISISEGRDITQDRLSAQIQISREEEKEGQIFNVKRLIKKGKSFGDIAIALDLPKSTVARLARSLRGARQSQARMKRSVLSLAECPPEAFSSDKPALPPSLSAIRRLSGK